MRKILSLALAAAMVLSFTLTVWAGPSDVVAPERDFEFDASTGTITGYIGPGGDVVIPSTIGGVTVRVIGDWVFAGNDRITSVIIPYGVTHIGYMSFFYYSLTSITIPASVTSIDRQAFVHCRKLYTVYFESATPPATVGGNAFFDVAPGARAMVPPGATAFGPEGSLWNGLIVTYNTNNYNPPTGRG